MKYIETIQEYLTELRGTKLLYRAALLGVGILALNLFLKHYWVFVIGWTLLVGVMASLITKKVMECN